MNTMIDSIYEAKDATKVELVELLTDEIEQKQSLILGDIRRIFIMINSLLEQKSSDIFIDNSQADFEYFLGQSSALQKHLLATETETGMTIIQQTILKTLSDSSGEVRKSAKGVFLNFIKVTRNAEQIVIQLVNALSSQDFYIRERSINLLGEVIAQEKGMFNSRAGVNEVRRGVEALVVHTRDINQGVRESAIKALRKIKFTENFDNVYKRLATEDQLTIDKIQRELPRKVDKFIQLNLSCIQDEQLQQPDFKPLEFLIRNELSDYPQHLQTQLYFGYLHRDILQDTLNIKDLTVRENGILELNRTFFVDHEDELSVNAPLIENIVNGGFMPSFFKYISSLFTSQDYKIINVLLNIISKIISLPGVHVNVYLPLCLPGLVKCLSDDRVIIRQRSLNLLKTLTDYLKSKQYIQNLIYFLEENKNENWHVKEEILNLLSYSFLKVHPREEWFYTQYIKKTEINQESPLEIVVTNLKPVDFRKIINQIACFLDDRIPKVKVAALECLSLLCYLQRKHLDYLHEILASEVYDKILDKIDHNIIYYINYNNNLELPQFDIKKFEQEKQSFIVSQMSKAESIIEPQQEIESEESAESNYKVTYFYDKFPMSLQDKIRKSNQSLDRLFASELGIDNMKYDMVVPVNQIQVTSIENYSKFNSNMFIQKEQQQIDDEVMESSEDEKLESVEFSYPSRTFKHRGHTPEQITNSKVQPITDVKSRVYNTIRQLNEDINVDMQIPKVLRANVGAYQGYQYIEEPIENDSFQFLNTKDIQKEHKDDVKTNINQRVQKQVIEPVVQEQNTVNTEQNLKAVQQLILNEQLKFTPEQKYQRRLDEFLLTSENREVKGKNARKIQRNLQKQAQQELPKIIQFQVKIDNPVADINALIINLSARDIQLLMQSLEKLKLLLTHHLTQVYASQAPLLQIVGDVGRLLSTSNDNPLYSIDYSQYKQPQLIMRAVALNAMQTLSVCAQQLKRVLIQVQPLFQNIGIWLQDDNKIISSQAEQTLLDIIKHCDDSSLSEVLPKLYNRNSYASKIYIGVLMEHLVLKHQNKIMSSPHFSNIISLISQMIIDNSFDVRRQGKKVFFKILNYGHQQARSLLPQLPRLEQDSMRALIDKHNELLTDHQIGEEFQQEEYMALQAVPEMRVPLDLDDFYHYE